ncbi:MAG TPA: GNAT family N-acetyltransferase [Pyrinomonadaceae bacterium]|nr:GNAT family N-acetyltransferase [Pyrinomonadaceae bacterium]
MLDTSVKPYMTKIAIRGMKPADWEDVSAIYADGMAAGQATFETDLPSWESWNRSHLQFGRLVAAGPDGTIGWAALSPVSSRRAYAGVAEVSVYVAGPSRGQGVGRSLLVALIEEAEKHGIWTLQAVVFPENIATLALHRGCGFREVGRRERIGKLNGVWRDTILLERRSKEVGMD